MPGSKCGQDSCQCIRQNQFNVCSISELGRCYSRRTLGMKSSTNDMFLRSPVWEVQFVINTQWPGQWPLSHKVSSFQATCNFSRKTFPTNLAICPHWQVATTHCISLSFLSTHQLLFFPKEMNQDPPCSHEIVSFDELNIFSRQCSQLEAGSESRHAGSCAAQECFLSPVILALTFIDQRGSALWVGWLGG